jgi:hypothetical protein
VARGPARVAQGDSGSGLSRIEAIRSRAAGCSAAPIPAEAMSRSSRSGLDLIAVTTVSSGARMAIIAP